MKLTLLQMVQSILNDMDSEPVNSISDTVEAQQIASVIKDTYFNIISAREIPEHDRLLKLTALSDSSKPVYFLYPTDLKEIRSFEYNDKVVYWKDPLKFLEDMPTASSADIVSFVDPNSGITLYAKNNKGPRYYTSLDDEYILCDSYDSSVDSSLQSSKTKCWGTVYPTFSLVDSHTPDLDNTLHPYLLAEAKSVCFSLFKSGSDPKVEQAARRLKSFQQNDLFKTKRENKRPLYGRN